MGAEDAQQTFLFDWIRLHEPQYPALRFCFHTPNGGMRNKVVATKLKRMGTRRGVPDVLLPHKAKGFSGLAIEMKVGRNRPTKEQREFLAYLRSQGWLTKVCYSWVAAAAVIRAYLDIPNDMFDTMEVVT